MGANTQGLATLQMLNILENFDLRGMGFQSAASIHAQIEAKRLAYQGTVPATTPTRILLKFRFSG